MAMVQKLLFGAALACAAAKSSPLIGIFTLPVSTYGEVPLDPCEGRDNCQILPASYVRFIEAAGGEVVPVSYNTTDEEIDHLVGSLNGFLFTGGGDVDMPASAHRMLTKSKELHEAGRVLPVLGICLGYEWLIQYAAYDALQSNFSAQNVTLPLKLTPNAMDSRLMSSAPPEILEAMTTKNTAFNAHHRGVSPEQWARFPRLAETFKVLSTSNDLNGREFVSTVEGEHGVPWYGMQWHPEKNAFEHGIDPNGQPYEVIPHTPEAVAVEQFVANYFVEQARKNGHFFVNEEEENQRLIYGRPTSQALNPEFIEVYVIQYETRSAMPMKLTARLPLFA